jgi:hypothetical protein
VAEDVIGDQKQMSNFNAKADLHMVEMTGHKLGTKNTASRLIHSGTVVECAKKVMAKDELERALYSMTVPLEAGFIKAVLDYRDIEAISQRPDFPRA